MEEEQTNLRVGGGASWRLEEEQAASKCKRHCFAFLPKPSQHLLLEEDDDEEDIVEHKDNHIII